MSSNPVPIRAITRPPSHHFFGYYEKTPWDASERFVLGLRVGFMNRMPTPDDSAGIGLIDTQQGDTFAEVAATRAFNMQQGCMLQWLPNAADRMILFNDREGGRFVTVVFDVRSGAKKVLPRATYAVMHSGRAALTLNFARLHRWRPVTGYAGADDPDVEQLSPKDDGVHRLDLQSGDSRLLLSLDQIAHIDPQASMAGAAHWFEHLQVSPTSERVAFLHRWRTPPGPFFTRMFAMNPDGTALHSFAAGGVSHFDWVDGGQLLVWARHGNEGQRFLLFGDRSDRIEAFGVSGLDRNGHCSFSPDRKWLLSDTYPDASGTSELFVVRLADGRRFELGRFHSPPELKGDVRCDLHPRWSRSGRQVCIDSAHEGSRQMYVLDVSAFVDQK